MRRLLVLVAPVLALVALTVLVPRATGAAWSTIGAGLRHLSGWQVAGLATLWAAGLLVHSSVLMAVLPGLSRRRALTLNLTGSALANLVPLGGGAGIGLNYVMVTGWGFSRRQFSLLTVLSNVLHLLSKALLPALALLVILVADLEVGRSLVLGVLAISVVLLAVVGAAASVVLSERAEQLLTGVVRRLAVLLRVRRDPAAAVAVLGGVRVLARDVLGAHWRLMAVSLTGYYLLGGVLLGACLHALGAGLDVRAVLVLFAGERALTALPFTPGGVGLVEPVITALGAVLAGPQHGTAVVAGILLYRSLVVGLEIPVGGAWLAGWLVARRMRRAATTPVPALPDDEEAVCASSM